MAGVNVPNGNSSGDPLQTLLPIGGAVAGGILSGGNPAAIMAGSKLGGMVAGSGKNDGPGAIQPAGDGTPISRRIGTLEDHPSVQLAKADAALQQLPPQYQQQYGPTIAAARQRDTLGGV